MKKRWPLVALLGVVCATALTGCGGGSSSDDEPGGAGGGGQRAATLNFN